MKIWLIQRAEPLPIDGYNPKLMRTGVLARYLHQRGHRIVWWTSAFDHYKKEHRRAEHSLEEIMPGYSIYMIKGTGYRKNISFSRLLDQKVLVQEFIKLAERTEKPDIILSSLPSVEMSYEAVKYGQKKNVPVILDIRDMWPDLFFDIMPAYLKPFGKIIFKGMQGKLERACWGAAAITGVNEPFVDWGLKKGRRMRRVSDKAFPLGYLSYEPSGKDISEAENFWDKYGISAAGPDLKIVFVGSIGSQFDISAMIRAIKKCNRAGCGVKFIVCGCGDKLGYYEKIARKDKNIIFAGWVNFPELYVLMRRCSLGLAPLPDNRNFIPHINNKAIEYMSAGLPVISSPKKGRLFELLRDNNCGASYTCGDEEELTGLIMDLSKDKGRIGEMASNAIRVFNDRFTAEKVYTDMSCYIETVAYKAGV